MLQSQPQDDDTVRSGMKDDVRIHVRTAGSGHTDGENGMRLTSHQQLRNEPPMSVWQVAEAG
eukprot:1714150-Amphidinium_carterae.1